MSTITTLNSGDSGATSRGVINTNFTNLNTDKAETLSPVFTGTPSLPTGTVAITQSASNNSTKVATTAYVDAGDFVTNLVYKNGITTYDLSTASGNQIIAHELGKTPKKIKITILVPANIYSTSFGVYNGTTTSCVYDFGDASGNHTKGTDSTNIARAIQSATTFQVATITVDSTNITLSWTKTNAPTLIAQIIWEAE